MKGKKPFHPLFYRQIQRYHCYLTHSRDNYNMSVHLSAHGDMVRQGFCHSGIHLLWRFFSTQQQLLSRTETYEPVNYIWVHFILHVL